MLTYSDNAIPHGSRCYCCGRCYDMNEVSMGTYTDYYLTNGSASPCPSCFSQMIYGIEDPIRDNLLFRQFFSDARFSLLLQQYSLWQEASPFSQYES